MEDLRNKLKPGDTVKLQNVLNMKTGAGSAITLGEFADEGVIDRFREYSEMIGTVRSVDHDYFTLQEAEFPRFVAGDISVWPHELAFNNVDVNDVLNFLNGEV